MRTSRGRCSQSDVRQACVLGAAECLDAVGMLWEVDALTAKWHANFHTARQFREEKGGAACDLDAVLHAPSETLR